METYIRQMLGAQAGTVQVRSAPMFGVLAELQRHPLDFIVSVMRTCGPIGKTTIGRTPCYFVNDPELVKQVLIDNTTYTRGDLVMRQFRKIAGDENLITSTGNTWARLRRLMQPAFRRDTLDGFLPLMADIVVSLRDRWANLARTGEAVDVHEEMKRVTMNIASSILFGTRVDSQVALIVNEMSVIQRHMSQFWRWTPLGALTRGLPLVGDSRFEQAVSTLRGVVAGFIEERRRARPGTRDLLTMLLEAKDPETGSTFTEAELLSQVVAVFLAGYESTAATMGWVWSMLSTHPAVARKVRQELDQTVHAAVPTAEELARLDYSRMVLEEAMRLYPPVWLFSRTARRADRLGQADIPEGALLFVSPYALHRDPASWDNPEGFDPERFAPGVSEKRPRYAYIPFGGGPHVCIGMHFTFLESLLILAVLAREFTVELEPGCMVRPEVVMLLRPGPAVMTRIRRRVVS